ncbi:MAG: LysR family transcriptional regulator [Granulosicoccus sp.]|nr:LysR family transcriptional regulator [Granulosicoccus sp.]
MEHWAELRSALTVARLGTVMAAADALGVHRATIHRHIDTLEAYLEVPLFQRHARGYTPTDTGRDMMDAAGRADEIFTDFLGRATGLSERLSGSLKVTSLSGVAPLIIPVIDEFHRKHPNLNIEFIADEQLARLEHGEAHVAIRAGAKPTTPDYIVLPFRTLRFGLYASEAYIDKYGQIKGNEFHDHKFVGPWQRKSPLPYAEWMNSHIPPESFVLRTSSQQVINTAVQQGLAMGFVADFETHYPKLRQIIAPDDQWSITLWLVTHADLRRTLKVQEFLRFARQ